MRVWTPAPASARRASQVEKRPSLLRAYLDAPPYKQASNLLPTHCFAGLTMLLVHFARQTDIHAGGAPLLTTVA